MQRRARWRTDVEKGEEAQMSKPYYWENLKGNERGKIERIVVEKICSLYPEHDNGNRSPSKEICEEIFLQQTTHLDDPEWYLKDRANRCIRSCWRRHIRTKNDYISKSSRTLEKIKGNAEKMEDTNLRVSRQTHMLISSCGSKGESFDQILQRLGRNNKFNDEELGIFFSKFENLIHELNATETGKIEIHMQVEKKKI